VERRSQSGVESPLVTASSPRLGHDRLVEHPSLIIAVLASSFVALRVLRAAHGDTETAFELLRGGTGSVLIATAAELGPAALIVVSAAAIVMRVTNGLWPVSPWVFTPALALGVMMAPVVFLLATAFCAGAFLGIRILSKRSAESLERRRRSLPFEIPDEAFAPRTWEKAMAVGLVAIYGLLAVPLLITDTVWMPTEVLKLENGSHLVGYVREDGEWLRVIRRDDRLVEVIATQDVADRTVCARYDDWVWQFSLISLFGHAPDYPRCSDFD
jgi:hypothetical protein